MGISSDKRAIAFARLPRLVRDAARRFRRLTSLTVVTTFAPSPPDGRPRSLPLPPVHPLCAELLRRLPDGGPCDDEWRKHLRSTRKTGVSRVHSCPLGLRCAGVPIIIGGELLGLAKCVCDRGISMSRFRSIVGLLEDGIARPCQELQIFLLREEIHVLHVEVARLRRIMRPASSAGYSTHLPVTKDHGNEGALPAQTLTSRVLDYLSQHFAERELSLSQVARAVGKNDKYVAHLFARQVGERMRSHITRLRVQRACELLLGTSSSIEAVARESGFAHLVQFRQSFRRSTGVTASEYRQIFVPRARPEVRHRIPRACTPPGARPRGEAGRRVGTPAAMYARGPRPRSVSGG